MSRVYCSFPENYELIDAGGGRKLERWGEIVTIRPEHQAYFPAVLSLAEWQQQAHWEFIPQKPNSINGTWKCLKKGTPEQWLYRYMGVSANLETNSNKHIGVFPEQHYNWTYIRESLSEGQRFLNLFAYTGMASLIGRTTGAEVTHVDSMRGTLDKARQNMESSGLSDIKWVLEDALKFVKREVKRGNKYDLVQMDPPAWGLGAKGEKWQIEALLPTLLEEGMELLNPEGRLIINTYSPRVEQKEMERLIARLPKMKSAEVNELWMKSTTGKVLYFGIVARLTR